MFSIRKNKLNKIKTFIRNLNEGGIEKSDKEELIKMINPTIGIKAKSGDDKQIKVGKSKIGGRPDLPKDFKWPKANNNSMVFCAQYNLSEIGKYDKENLLPKIGFFYIFLSLDERYNEFNGVNQKFKFLYSKTVNVTRTEFPKDLQENEKLKTASIKYFEFFTIPDYENYKLFNFIKSYDNFLDDIYQPIVEYINESCGLFEDSYHQILGEDRSMQSSVVYDFASKELGIYGADLLECKKRWNETLEVSKDYKLLLQLDCYDFNADLKKFGGEGKYYFGITRENLNNKTFDDIKMSFQL